MRHSVLVVYALLCILVGNIANADTQKVTVGNFTLYANQTEVVAITNSLNNPDESIRVGVIYALNQQGELTMSFAVNIRIDEPVRVPVTVTNDRNAPWDAVVTLRPSSNQSGSMATLRVPVDMELELLNGKLLTIQSRGKVWFVDLYGANRAIFHVYSQSLPTPV